MALADVLSAMREIILDAPALPAEVSERERMFFNRFPRLTKEEREDLARIDPAKFSIYTISIFQGEKGILESHLPVTFSLVKEYWDQAYHEEFLGRRLTWKLHLSRPRKSQSALTFAANFAEFIIHDCPELIALRADLGSIALLECANYRLKRAPNAAPLHDIAIEALPALTVAELLEARVVPTSPRECLQLNFDVVSMREAFFSGNRKCPEKQAEKGAYNFVGARKRDNKTFWVSVQTGVFEFLNAAPKDEVTVELFADMVLQDIAEELAPEKALEVVTAELVRLMGAGVVMLLSADV